MEKPIRKYTKSAVSTDVVKNYKRSDEDRLYMREYQRTRYRQDSEFRQDAVDRTKRVRDKKSAEQKIGKLIACLLKKIEKGPLCEGFGVYIPKRRGRPRKIDENGNRFFTHQKK
jgi:hypothetical protein